MVKQYVVDWRYGNSRNIEPMTAAQIGEFIVKGEFSYAMILDAKDRNAYPVELDRRPIRVPQPEDPSTVHGMKIQGFLRKLCQE